MTSRILSAEFDYLKPATLDEALKILAEKDNIRILAGGTDVIVKMKVGGMTCDYLMDIKGIDALDYAKLDDNGVFHIGALAKLSHIEKNQVVAERYPALKEALHLMASISVRNMGTMAGNICNASPVADSVVPAICYKAVLTLSSVRGERTVPIEKFFLAPGVSVMEKDEMLIDIALPAPKANTGAAFVKKTRVRPDIAKISVGITFEREGNKAVDCRIAMGSIAATPAFLEETAAILIGKTVTESLISEAAAHASAYIKPITDSRTTSEYRTVIAEILTKDTLTAAWLNAGGEL